MLGAEQATGRTYVTVTQMGQAYPTNAVSDLGYVSFRVDASCTGSAPVSLLFQNADDGNVGMVETHASTHSPSNWFEDNVQMINSLSIYEAVTEGYLAHVTDGIVADLRQVTDAFAAPTIVALRVHSFSTQQSGWSRWGSSVHTVPSQPDLRDEVAVDVDVA